MGIRGAILGVAVIGMVGGQAAAAGAMVPAATAHQATAESASTDPARALRVSYFLSAQLTEEESAAMAAELERIFGDIGFAVHAYSPAELTGLDGVEISRVLRVVIVDRGPSNWGINPAAIGAMIGKQLPPTAVYVFDPVLRTVLGIANKPDGYMRAEEIGRAFARIIAHEVVHAYAPDHPHTGWGLMGHAQDSQSLTQADLGIDPRSARAFTEAYGRVLAMLRER